MTLDIRAECQAPSLATGPTPALQSLAAEALSPAVERLLSLQKPDGAFVGELESNVSITAEYLLMRRYLGIADSQREAAIVAYLRGQQLADGSYSIAPGIPGDISVTAEAWLAFRAAGVAADDPQVAAARLFVSAKGGLHNTRLFTRIWMALGGLWPWESIPAVPPEWLLIPGRQAGSVYDLASWARATTVPISILRTLTTVFPLESPSREELPLGTPRPGVGSVGWKAVERVLRTYGRLPEVGVRSLALARAERWILDHQEADGSWAGIQPPWVYGLMALRARGRTLEDPAIKRGLSALETFGIEDRQGFRLQACVSPVWDTALALWALLNAGIPQQDQSIRRAVDWLVSREVSAKGDWAVRRSGPRGGWPFEYYNDQYPDTDDTAVVLCALRAAGHHRNERSEVGASMNRALGWLLAMQGKDGGYAAFDADNDRPWVERLPISDFGEVLDRASPDVTAHVLEAYARCGGPDLAAASRRALAWIRRSEEGEGAYFGRWGVNYVYGGAAVATSLAAVADPTDQERLRRIGDWVLAHQHRDGGFGESVLSYQDPQQIGHGEATPSQTAWALLSLLSSASGSPRHDDGAIDSGALAAVSWLREHQEESGGWTDQLFTGTGFPGYFYLNYHLYATTFPVMALARAADPARSHLQPNS